MGAELEPVIGFFGFLGCYLALVHKVGAAFGVLGFAHIGSNGSAAAQQLASHNVTTSRFQFFHISQYCERQLKRESHHRIIGLRTFTTCAQICSFYHYLISHINHIITFFILYGPY